MYFSLGPKSGELEICLMDSSICLNVQKKLKLAIKTGAAGVKRSFARRLEDRSTLPQTRTLPVRVHAVRQAESLD